MNVDNDNNQNNEKDKYIYETMRYVCPARLMGSRYKMPRLQSRGAVHDIFYISRDSKYFGSNTNKFSKERFNNYKSDMSGGCPFMKTKPLDTFKTKKTGATIQCGFKILEKDGYIMFGSGYRRCPGELISITFLEELIKLFEKYPVRLYLKNNISIKDNFIFDIIETNYYMSV